MPHARNINLRLASGSSSLSNSSLGWKAGSHLFGSMEFLALGKQFYVRLLSTTLQNSATPIPVKGTHTFTLISTTPTNGPSWGCCAPFCSNYLLSIFAPNLIDFISNAAREIRNHT